MMRLSLTSALIASLALAGCGKGPDAPTVARAWVRLPAVTGQPGAAYFELKGGRSDERLIKVESALVGRIELHESMTGMHGMGTMKPIDGADLPKGGTVAFAPGGRHAMLFAVEPVVKPGTAIPLRFGFASGRIAEAEAKTVGAGGDAPY